MVLKAPHFTRTSRVDEVGAARKTHRPLDAAHE